MLHCIPRTYPKSLGGACAFLLHFLTFGGCGQLYQIGLTGFGNRSDRFWWNRSDWFWEPAWPVCAQNWHLFRGSLHMWRGSSCMLWWFVFFTWAWFCLGWIEPLPLPKGSETCPLQVILLYAFFRLSIACWSFFWSFLFFPFLWLSKVCVVNALIKGEIEDHVWFEDRWMVASWCDEWLTTLCGLILG
jgi:hypothetical protein